MSLAASTHLLLLGLLISSATSGCIAGIRAGEVPKNRPAGATTEGLRYFLPAQYFVIEQIADGQWDARFQSVVDRSHEYYVQPYAYLSSGKARVEFNDDGTLKSFRLEADATAVPDAAITAIKDVQLKREELKRAELDARAKAGAGFTATKPLMSKAEGSRAVFLYRVVGDELKGQTPDHAPTIQFANTRPSPPSRDLPRALDSNLLVEPGDVDEKIEIAVGIKGVQLTKELAIQRLRFGQLEQSPGRAPSFQAATPDRQKAIVNSAQERAGRLVFKRGDLWDVDAIGIVP
jgi:hypothetical protein